jgi:quercetin 2,3-dioxygenase
MLLPLDPSNHMQRASGPFQIRRMHPGAMLGNTADGGFGGLGLIDRANLSPGLKVAMHEHRDDEIVSYLRAGTMVHQDSTGVTEEVRPNRLMVMNAGSGFSHEETVPGPDNVHMLQIFIRPSEAGMTAGVQFHDLAETYSLNSWRLLAGPEGSGATGTVRQQALLHDVRLQAGRSLTLPAMPGFDGWLYVFDGSIMLDGRAMQANDAMALIDHDEAVVTAALDSDLVLFLIDRNATASRAGTLSGR